MLTRRLVAASLAIVAGCTDLTGLSGAGDATAVPGDAGTSGTDAFAGSDATADGGTDGNLDAAPDGSSVCAQSHTFCDDFDGPGGLAAWTIDTTAGPVALTTADVASAPNALRVQTGATAPSNASAKVARSFKAAARFHVELKLKLATQTDGNVYFLEIDSNPTTQSYFRITVGYAYSTLNLGVSWGGLDGGSGSDSKPFTGLFGGWHHVALDGDFGSKTLSMTLDHATSPTATVNLPVPLGPQDIYLQLGAVDVVSVSSAWTTDFDDFVLDVVP